jgi:aspartate carbamoyltransferase catalytic subunit
LPSEREFVEAYGLTRERASALKSDALVMHAGPMNRGVELDWDVAESGASVIEEQVSAGVAVRMSLLYSLLSSASMSEVPA